MGTAFVVDEKDNVATALETLCEKEAMLLGAQQGRIPVEQEIPRGHKVALREIARGSGIVKHGHIIAIATANIAPGEWVHSHNAASPSAPEQEM